MRTQLFQPSRPIYTKVRDDTPAKYGLGSQISNSIVADGCIIDGEVENCVLFRGVKVKKGREAEKLCDYAGHRSGENTRLDYVVADKNVVFENDRTLMGYQTYPVYVSKKQGLRAAG